MKNKKPISRSENMRRIKSKDTSIEILLRKELWKRGLRYRKNVKDVFGKPDIVFKGKKLAVFTDSEFWHGKYLMEKKYIPKTNTEYWVKKITRNIERDKEVVSFLEEEGWTVLRFWESDIRKSTKKCADIIEGALKRL
ncbi:very short patch repair endonuclease [Sulfurovum sp. NBC37-1]|uniref:very short patch repair endonuclease n=1 Tax=Sulfurovum sp. (strain NBC37-1) TaxID=387093 RepID=UPI0001587B13|nr:very short patch repair endonuclease [Sulfurovum sp. NBC37-1]BAF73363.1 DNA mismatch endonuclease Vsr [Sulfurovum sp. NBC37-1]